MAELGLGQRALWGVLLDLAACPLVTQVRWLSPTHNAPLELRAPETAFFSQGPKQHLGCSRTFEAQARCHQIFIHSHSPSA